VRRQRPTSPPPYQVLADGQPWIDADGLDEWDSHEVWALAESLERRGYLVEVVPA